MHAAEIALIAVIVLAVIVLRLRGEPLRFRRLVVIPTVLAGIGLVKTAQDGADLTASTVAMLGVGIASALVLGAIRGRTIEVTERGGRVWYRYRPATVAVWVVSAAVRGAEVALQHHSGAADLGSGPLLLLLGASLLAEAAVVYPRAQRLGVPFAADDRSRPARLR